MTRIVTAMSCGFCAVPVVKYNKFDDGDFHLNLIENYFTRLKYNNNVRAKNTNDFGILIQFGYFDELADKKKKKVPDHECGIKRLIHSQLESSVDLSICSKSSKREEQFLENTEQAFIRFNIRCENDVDGSFIAPWLGFILQKFSMKLSPHDYDRQSAWVIKWII